MQLVKISERPEATALLYELLKERDPIANISHREMPSTKDHSFFVAAHPYEAWYLIEDESQVLGAIYLTKQNEIGISLFKAHQDKGIGPQAVRMLMAKHGKRRYVANIAPANERSSMMFRKLGFNLVQHTYALSGFE